MKIVADFHHTVTDMPQLFSQLSKNNELIVISGSDNEEKPKIDKFLVEHDILADSYTPPAGMRPKNWKVDFVVSMKPDVYYEDDLRMILAVRRLSPQIKGIWIVTDEIDPIK